MSTDLILSGILTATLTAAEHALLAQPLRHHELARRVIGVATVLSCASVPVLTGQFDWRPFAYVTALFFVAGGVMWVFDITERTLAHNRAAEAERDEITTARG